MQGSQGPTMTLLREETIQPSSSLSSSFVQEILSMEVGAEPTATSPGKVVARVQIRIPDGKRLVQRFLSNNPVKDIYAFGAQNNEKAKGGRVFELKAKFLIIIDVVNVFVRKKMMGMGMMDMLSSSFKYCQHAV